MSFCNTTSQFLRHSRFFIYQTKTIKQIINVHQPIIKPHPTPPYFSSFHSLVTPRCITPLNYCSCVVSFRGFAKGKDKKKNDKVKGKKNIQVNDEALSEVIDVESMKNQMQKSLDILRDEYIKNVSLRSSAGSIETLRVKLDGNEHTLQELAQVVRKNPKTIVINLATFPQAIPAVLQAIQSSGMNLNPQQDGTTLFVPVPVVTREHRENLSRSAKTLYIKSRDAIKDVQNKFIKGAKKRTDISEDEVFGAQQQIGSLADQYLTQAEKMLQAKQQELVGKD